MKRYSTYLVILLLFNCKKVDCIFDNNFNQVYERNVLPDLTIKSNDNNCNELVLTGDFGYFLKEYKIKKKLNIKDSLYRYNSNENILFDFSNNKSDGVLNINDSINLKVKFFMDIKSKQINFRLFKTDNVSNFYTLNLSKVYITNYNYGIVGEFIVGKEDNEWVVVGLKGYIPNEKYFFSIFKKVELL